MREDLASLLIWAMLFGVFGALYAVWWLSAAYPTFFAMGMTVWALLSFGLRSRKP